MSKIETSFPSKALVNGCNALLSLMVAGMVSCAIFLKQTSLDIVGYPAVRTTTYMIMPDGNSSDRVNLYVRTGRLLLIKANAQRLSPSNITCALLSTGLAHVKVHHLVDVSEVSVASRELASLPQRHFEWSKVTYNRATTSILGIVDPSTLSQSHKA